MVGEVYAGIGVFKGYARYSEGFEGHQRRHRSQLGDYRTPKKKSSLHERRNLRLWRE